MAAMTALSSGIVSGPKILNRRIIQRDPPVRRRTSLQSDPSLLYYIHVRRYVGALWLIK